MLVMNRRRRIIFSNFRASFLLRIWIQRLHDFGERGPALVNICVEVLVFVARSLHAFENVVIRETSNWNFVQIVPQHFLFFIDTVSSDTWNFFRLDLHGF